MRYVTKIFCSAALACTAVLCSDAALAQTEAPSELTLTYPNGGEQLTAGGSAVITWAGVAPEQDVRLDYSADAGRTWKTITPKAKGLRYEWKNIPPAAAGTTTLVRVSKGTFADDYDPENPAPSIVWQKIIGGSKGEYSGKIIQDDDGSLVITGHSYSKDGDMKHNDGNFLVPHVIKLNSQGKILWSKAVKISGSADGVGNVSILQDREGKYVVAGQGREFGNEPRSGFVVSALNKQTGEAEWSKTFVDSGTLNLMASLFTLRDGNYVAVGETASFVGEIGDARYQGKLYCWIAKLEAGSGRVLKQNFLSLPDRGLWARGGGFEDDDGNYVVGVHNFNDAWLMKIKPKDNSTVWAAHLYSYQENFSLRITGSLKTRDGHYVVTGRAALVVWIKKVEARTGTVVWAKTFEGKGLESLDGIIEATDGGYVVAGAGSLINGQYGTDGLLLKLRPEDGSVQWSKTFGGSSSDWATSVVETDDGGYAMLGGTFSNDRDLKGYKKKSDDSDLWIVKLSEPVIEQVDISDGVFAVLQAEATSRDVQIGSCAVGSSVSVPVPDFIANTGSAPLAVESIAIQGADAAAFSILSPPPPYSIPAGSVRPVEFRFKPFKVGTHRAKVVIRTARGTATHTIEGTGARP